MNGKKTTMHRPSRKVIQTEFKSTDKMTRILKKCSDLKEEETRMNYILTSLGIDLRLTLKLHHEISAFGFKYALGCAKVCF